MVTNDSSRASGSRTDDRTVKLRPMPFPYMAALSICSDIDECDQGTFSAVHRCINDPDDGLGLPIADSFFAVGRVPGQLAYFLPDGMTRGPDADLIIEAVRAGLIDSLHSWGDFNGIPPPPSFLRDVAARLTEDFTRRGFQLQVWINHGDPNNKQNLRARLQPGYAGHDPGSPFYTLDLVRALGIRYYWASELVNWPLSCHQPTVTMRVTLQPYLNHIKNLVKIFLGRRRLIRTTSQIRQLCSPVRFADDCVLWTFNRYQRGLWKTTNRHTLHYTLAPRVLDELITEQGYLILYTHLGIPRFEGGELFPDADLRALRHLADLYHQGKIWVGPTAQVLNHWLVSRTLEWQTVWVGDKLIVQLDTIRDPLTGPRPPNLDELAGLCFKVPKNNETILRVAGRDYAPKIYGLDHTGGWFVGFDAPSPPEIGFLPRLH